jgi:2'-5' RNA ligase
MEVSQSPETALVILVPEAEPLLEAYRQRFDPASLLGMPAHITVLYPFEPPNLLSAGTIAALQALVASQPAFHLTLAEFGAFPEVLYLKPEPTEPLHRLMERIARLFPAYPPYGGVHDQVIPHLTVGPVSDPSQVETVRRAFEAVAAPLLPVQTWVRAVSLMDNAAGAWQVRAELPLETKTML